MPKVVLFASSFEPPSISHCPPDGAAMTLGQIVNQAHNYDLDLLVIYGHNGPKKVVTLMGRVTMYGLPRSKFGFKLDHSLRCDVLMGRYWCLVKKMTKEFGAQVIHTTDCNDLAIMGSILARDLNLPLVAGWHTNEHEYAAHRLRPLLHWLPKKARDQALDLVQKAALWAIIYFVFRYANAILAPNKKLVCMLAEMTGKSSQLMSRGINQELFNPSRRTRTSISNNEPLRIGFVGRLATEKGLGLMLVLADAAKARGIPVVFQFVGEGPMKSKLEEEIPGSTLGKKIGTELAETYANMDLFVFPSTTDTFGNVVLEAVASGVPALVIAGSGGPESIITHGVNGWVARSEREFLCLWLKILSRLIDLPQMRNNAHLSSQRYTWERVAKSVFELYSSLA